MAHSAYVSLCISHIADGLRDGLSRFSRTSRTALVYALEPDGPVRVYDPQDLLSGHEPRLEELYLRSEDWKAGTERSEQKAFEPFYGDTPHLAGLISRGGRAGSIAYQMWFTEHHPDICSPGPQERWLEYAANLLSQDLMVENILRVETSGHVIQEYAKHAVRDYIVDRRNETVGWDTKLRVYPILDAVLAVSKTREEGAWPRGKLVFVEPHDLPFLDFMARFPDDERPDIQDSKHVRKLLQAVESSERKLVSDGARIIGVASGHMPSSRLVADFRGSHGFLRLDNDLVCSFCDGSFQASTRRSKLVQVEEALLESGLPEAVQRELYQLTLKIVHHAEEKQFGCSLVLDLGQTPVDMAGQRFEEPLDLRVREHRDLARSLAKVDGSLHIGADLRLHGFACLMDGLAVPGESRARGARYNSALRFTALHEHLLVVVLSSDRPVSVIQRGVELTARCEWRPLTHCLSAPPTVREWLGHRI